MLAICCLFLSMWLIFNAVFAMINGSYLLPEVARPWVNILDLFDIEPFGFATALLALGVLWFVALYSILSQKPWGKSYIFFTALSTLFYAPIGLFFSQLCLVILTSYLAPRNIHKNHMISIGAVMAIITTSLLTYGINSL